MEQCHGSNSSPPVTEQGQCATPSGDSNLAMNFATLCVQPPPSCRDPQAESATSANPVQKQTADTENDIQAPGDQNITTQAEIEFEGATGTGDDLGEETEAEKDSADDDNKDQFTVGDMVLVSPDQTEIFDPATRSFVDMPTNLKEKKAALMKIFFYYTKFLFFHDLNIEIADLFEKVPQKLWNIHFTLGQTEAMVKAQAKVLMNDMGSRYEKVVAEWLEVEGCPIKKPKSLEELQELRSEEESKSRVDWVAELLLNKNERSDGWIRHVHGNVEDMVDLDLSLAEGSPFRKYLATRMACMVDAYVEGFIFEGIERRLTFERIIGEQIDGLFGDLAELAMAGGEASRERGALSDSEDDLDLDW